MLYVETLVRQLRLNHVHTIFCELWPTYLKVNVYNILHGPAVITSKSLIVEAWINLHLPIQNLQIEFSP